MTNIYSRQNKLFQAWFWVLYIPVILLLFIDFFKPGERNIGSDILAAAVVLLPLLFLLSLRFSLVIDQEKITYQYFPIQLSPRSLAWSEVESAQLVVFDPLKHYWGYGYRKSRKYGRVYNTTGNIGLLITTKQQAVLNFEITDQKDFCRFVQDNRLDQINIHIIPIEKALGTAAG